VIWESVLIRGGWQRGEILRTPAEEVFAHVQQVRRFLSDDRQWQLSAAVQPNREAEDQTACWEQAKQIGEFGKRRRRSPYDLVPPETRIVMIGGDLEVYGDAWAASHPGQMDWLARQGVTRDEAIGRNAAWLRKRLDVSQ
jgi:hypothetical protein